MNILHEKRDVFTVPQGYYILGALSTDFEYNVGFPKAFDNVFDLKYRIKKCMPDDQFNPGDVLTIGNAIVLFVKESSYDAVDEKALYESLMTLRDVLEEEGIEKIAMPKICSGKNGIPWDITLDVISHVFRDADVEILICE